MVKKDVELFKSIVNEVVAENLKPIESRLNAMEKQLKALSVDNSVTVEKQATSKSTKSTKSTKKATKSEPTVKITVLDKPLAKELGYDVVKWNESLYIRQTTYQKDRKYRELAMKNDGRLMKDSKMKCYEFKTEAEVDKALKAIKKSKDAYKKSVAK